MGIPYKIKAIILTIVLLSVFSAVNAQYKYSIDIKSRGGQRAPMKYAVLSAKKDFQATSAIRKKIRTDEKVSKKIKRHTYKIQTLKVKKRMRKSEKTAKNYNRGKVPLSVKLKKLF